jgi:hypothetical protein
MVFLGEGYWVSTTGVWIVGMVPDEELARVRREFPRLPFAGGLSPRFPADLTWWREKSASEQFFDLSDPRGPVPTAAALRFWAFVENSRVTFDAVERMKDAVMDLFPQESGEGVFCATARRPCCGSGLCAGAGCDTATPRLVR